MPRGIYARAPREPRPPKPCAADGCGLPSRGRWCAKHHARWHRYRSTELPERARRAPKILKGRAWTPERRAARSRRLGDPIERLLEKVEFDLIGGCWLWSGDASDAGYGRVKQGGQRHLAHRLSWVLHYGQITEGMNVCHRCDTPACINPHHLFLGTQSDNMRDAVKKGRWRAGRRAALDGATPRKGVSRATRKRLFERCGGRCTCGADLAITGFDADHTLPLALGGSLDDDNLEPLCPACHKAKTKADIRRIAKTKRQAKACLPRPAEEREPGSIRSRGFEKPRIKTRWPKRPFPGRKS